jgi:hypothetical protein
MREEGWDAGCVREFLLELALDGLKDIRVHGLGF